MKTTINGIQIAYTDEGQGTPLLFVHGFPLSRGAWQKQVEEFSGRYRVIAPDLRGHGESEATHGAVTMENYARDLQALLDQLKTGPVILIGHSMGGYIAFAFARMFPQFLRGLVLVATRAVGDSPEAAAGRRATAEKVRKEGVQSLVDSMVPKMLSSKSSDLKMVQEVRGLMSSSKPEGVAGALLGMAQRPDSTPDLGKLELSTLLISGDDDALIPYTESEKMSKSIFEAKLEIIPHAGHLVAFESPQEFNRRLEAWLAASAGKH